MGNPGDLARLPAFAVGALQPWLWGGSASVARLEAHRLAAVQALDDARKRLDQAMAPIQTKVVTAQSEAQRVAAFAELQELQKRYRDEVQAQLNAFFTPGDGLTLKGDPADQQALLSMVRHEMLRSPSFHALILGINADRQHPVEITAARNDRSVLMDNFDSAEGFVGQQRIDLGDVDKLPVDPPESHPNAATQGEILAHAMAEAREAARSLAGSNPKQQYDLAHSVAIKAQNDYRDDRGQQGHRREAPDDGGRNADGNWDMSYDNAYSEVWKMSGDTPRERNVSSTIVRIDRY